MLHDIQTHPLPILPLHLRRTIEQQPKQRTHRLDSDKHQENSVRHLAGLVTVRIEAEVDGAAQDLPAQPEGQPVPQRLAAVPRLRIGNGDGGLSHPEDAGRDAAQRGAEERQPLGAEAVVRVEAGRVRGVADAVKSVSYVSRMCYMR